MKLVFLFLTLLLSNLSFSQDIEWIKTEGEIIDITFHRSRKVREIATVKFNLENGEEQIGSVELYRIPFIGSMKSIGDNISINYDKSNPGILETVMGKFLFNYGMYILIALGIIFSLKPILNWKKSINKTN